MTTKRMFLSKNLILEKLAYIAQFTVLILHHNTGNYTFHYNFIFNFQQSQNILQIPPFPFNPFPPIHRFIEKRFFAIALFLPEVSKIFSITSFYGWGAPASRLQTHYKETV